MAKLSFGQEEILSRLEALDRTQAELENRIRAAEATIAEHEAAVKVARNELEGLTADTASALDRERLIHDRVDRFSERVAQLLATASSARR